MNTLSLINGTIVKPSFDSRPRRLITLIAFNALVGLVFARYFFGGSFLKGQVAVFMWPQGDMTQYLTGAKFFIYDSWRFPIFISDFLERSTPQSMAFTDTIPLFALLAKIIYKLTGCEIVHLAYWYPTAVVLQPVSLSLLLWSIGVRNLLLNLAGGVLSILVPAFLYRSGHAPLFGHFTFITAMALYFITIREFELRREIPRVSMMLWLVLLLCNSLVNMYVLAMSLLFFAISWTQVAIVTIKDRGWTSAWGLWLCGGGTILTLVAFMYATGWLVPYSGGGSIGHHSMNLLSPVVPQISSLFKVPGMLDATGGQYEGYNYLGAGFLLLLLFAFVLAGDTDVKFLRIHALFLLGLALCTLFALSNRAYAGTHLLWSVPAPDFLGNFRSSGRFIWPVTYFLLAFGVSALNDKLSSVRLTVVLVACIYLQWADTRDLSAGIWNMGHSTNRPEPREDAEAIRKLIAQHAGVHVEPDYGCPPHSSLSKETMEDIAFLAAQEKKPINTMYLSRQPIDWTCNIKMSEMIAKLDAGYLGFTFYDSGTIPVNRDRSSCAEFSEYAVCVESPRIALSEGEVHQLFSGK